MNESTSTTMINPTTPKVDSELTQAQIDAEVKNQKTLANKQKATEKKIADAILRLAEVRKTWNDIADTAKVTLTETLARVSQEGRDEERKLQLDIWTLEHQKDIQAFLDEESRLTQELAEVTAKVTKKYTNMRIEGLEPDEVKVIADQAITLRTTPAREALESHQASDPRNALKFDTEILKSYQKSTATGQGPRKSTPRTPKVDDGTSPDDVVTQSWSTPVDPETAKLLMSHPITDASRVGNAPYVTLQGDTMILHDVTRRRATQKFQCGVIMGRILKSDIVKKMVWTQYTGK